MVGQYHLFMSGADPGENLTTTEEFFGPRPFFTRETPFFIIGNAFFHHGKRPFLTARFTLKEIIQGGCIVINKSIKLKFRRNKAEQVSA